MPFIIQPHTRIQEWVALEKGYFEAEELDYQLTESFAARFKNPTLKDKGAPAEIKAGAYEMMESAFRPPAPSP